MLSEPFIVRLLQAAVALTVTILPLEIVTTSPEPGIAPPFQVEVAFQFPEALLVIVAEYDS
jgi:hypothetical protein